LNSAINIFDLRKDRENKDDRWRMADN